MKTPTQRLMRSRSDRMVGGVAGGIARYLGVDPVVVRLVFVVLALMQGVGLLTYLIMLVIMPSEPRTAASNGTGAGSQAFVQGGPARTPRYDPMTGEPIDPEEEEIPVHNINREGADPQTAQMRRNWLLGVVLIGLGAFFMLRMLMPDLLPFVVPALLIAGGVFLMQRSNRKQPS
jgi:phage shock protein C